MDIQKTNRQNFLSSPSKKPLLKSAIRPLLKGRTLELPKARLNTLLAWKAPEFVFYKKTQTWYIVVGLIGLVLLIFAIFSQNYIMAITFILIFAVIFLFANKRPRELTFGITTKGIRIQNRIYKFDHLESFWIFYDLPHLKLLSLKSKKPLMPHIHVPLGSSNPVEIRKILLDYLEEKEQSESFPDIIARIIKF